VARRCPICGADHATCGGLATAITRSGIDARTLKEDLPMAELKMVQMRDGSTLQLNAEDEQRARDMGLVGESTGTGAAREPGPDDPTVFYDAGDLGTATGAKAVAGAPANKAITSKTTKGA